MANISGTTATGLKAGGAEGEPLVSSGMIPETQETQRWQHPATADGYGYGYGDGYGYGYGDGDGDGDGYGDGDGDGW